MILMQQVVEEIMIDTSWHYPLSQKYKINRLVYIKRFWKSMQQNNAKGERSCRFLLVILLMEEILHQLIGSLSHYLQGSIHPRWLFGISEPSTVLNILLHCCNCSCRSSKMATVIIIKYCITHRQMGSFFRLINTTIAKTPCCCLISACYAW